MYDESADTILHGTGRETFDAVKMLKAADPAMYKPVLGRLSAGPLRDSLRQLAQLIKADLGVQVAFADIGGWITTSRRRHAGQIANVLHDFSQSLSAFWIDLGNLADDTVIVTHVGVRPHARETATAAPIMAMQRDVRDGRPGEGGRVYGLGQSRSISALRGPRPRGNDGLPPRSWRSRVTPLGNERVDQVFPGFENQPGKSLRYLG